MKKKVNAKKMNEEIDVNANNRRNRLLIAFGIVILFIISWYYLFNESAKKENQYNQYIKNAHYYEKKQLYKKANEYYTLAKEMYDSYELECEIANMYLSWKKYYAYEDLVEEIIDNNKYSSKGYEMLLKYYYEDGEYSECVEVINTAKNRNVTSDYINEISDDLKYKFEYGYRSYADVGQFYNNMCVVKSKDGRYGIVYADGTLILSCSYMQLSPFVTTDITPMTDDGDKYWLIGKDGEVVEVSELDEGLKIEEIGTFAEGLIPVKINGEYCYTNSSFEKQFGNYEEAYAFCSGKAMVKDSNGYYLIDSKGNKLSDNIYLEIKCDEIGYTSRSGIYAVKKDGDFYLINSDEKQIGKDTYEDVKLMSEDEYMAVKKNGLWGFVNKKGEMVIEPQFLDARSFSNELAAVKINEKWGYIDKNGEVVIEAQFSDAKDFSEYGSAFVYNGDDWELIKRYK